MPIGQTARLLSIVAAVLLVGHTGAAWQPAPPRETADGLAWQLVDVPSGRVLDSLREDLLSRPAAPGSVVKIATLIAALESGTITASTRIACPGSVDIDGRPVACLHPRMRRPLGPAEALAHSCNAYFATIGQRLPRERLSGVLTALGLPPVKAGSFMAGAATGLDAAPVPPVQLLRALLQVLADPPGVAMRSPTRAVVVDGLRGAARFGTAAVFTARGVEAFAKTGTADAPGGGQQGLVVAAWPATRPTRAVVVLAAGGAGVDAAEVAVRIARGERPGSQPPAPRPTAVVPAPPASPRPGSTSGAGMPPSRPASPPAAANPARSTVSPAPVLPQIRVGVLQPSGRYAVRAFDLESYVARVLAGEAAPRSPAAALEALAITARTFAIANRRRHGREGFDLCDTTHCQVLREPYAAVQAAATATAGQLLVWQGAPAGVFYTASCGGRTERPSAVWRGALDPPYLPSRRDHGCGGEPRWSSEITAGDLLRALRAAGFRGDRLRDVRIRGRNGSGRVSVLELRGLEPDRISGQEFRMVVGRTLGWRLVKSTDFELRRSGAGYRFSGRGFGHGVGMCVIGATRRAAAGESRSQLLAAYFPGVRVSGLSAAIAATAPPVRAPESAPLASGDAVDEREATSRPSDDTATGSLVRLELPDGDAEHRPDLVRRAAVLLAGAERRTGLSMRGGLTLVFHPSVESFRRATGEPWWNAAVTRGTRTDLQPVGALLERGLLDATLAHEIGHVLTAATVNGRPAWVQEGAAMFAGGLIADDEIVRARESRERLQCPSDDEVRQPVSAGTAADAYARARACFARGLANGRGWQDVR